LGIDNRLPIAQYHPEHDPVDEAGFKRILIATGDFTAADDERMSHLFDTFDTSGDRHISFEEFIIGAVVSNNGSQEHKAECMLLLVR
jgi:Ca2+-binding EF-hand superfamily protein